MKVLLIALPLRLRARISGRLKEVEVQSASNAADAREALAKESFGLLVLQENPEALETLSMVREAYSGPVFFCASQPHKEDYLRRLLSFRVTAILQQPIDPDELVRCAAIELGIRVSAQEAASGLQMPPHLMAIWRRHHAGTMERAGMISEACQLGPANLAEEELERVIRAAHQLAGTLGSFGMGTATLYAREAEDLLKRAGELDQQQLARLAQLARALETQLADPSVRVTESAGGGEKGTLLIFTAQDGALDELVEAAAAEGWRPVVTGDPAGLRKILALEQPRGLVLDMANFQESVGLLQEVTGKDPGCPVVALVPSSDWLEMAGCQPLLKPAPAQAVLRALQFERPQTLEPRHTLLAVDDDPLVLEAVSSMLAGLPLEIHTLGQSLAFWDTLEEVKPDILILDVDMPILSGLELCRAVRNDPVYCRLPILFLSAYNDAATVHRVFQAGGDDYVYKPVVGPELRTRVANRLARARTYGAASPHPSVSVLTPASERPDLAVVAQDPQLVSEMLSLRESGYRVEHCTQSFDALLHRLTEQVQRRPRVLILQDPDGLEVLQRLDGVGVTSHTEVWVCGSYTDVEAVEVFELRGAGCIPAGLPPGLLKRHTLRLLQGKLFEAPGTNR